MQQAQKKILITGGHLTPALGYIDYVQQHDPSSVFIFVGREYSQSGQKSQEKTEVEQRQVPFISFSAPRLTTKNPVTLVTHSLQFVASVGKGIGLMLIHRPTVVLSFGGYFASPLALASWLLGIPVVTHEQTVVAGQANQWIARFATAVAVSHPSSLPYFPATKTTVTGNPLRASLLATTPLPSQPSWFTGKLTKPLLYITGGNQGSLIINHTIRQLLPQLTHDYTVIHACGNPSQQGDSYRELDQVASRLPAAQQKRYFVRTWISETELRWLYQHCFAAISRAGANTVAELTLFAIPTIYIPLPFAKNNEQELNIRPLVEKQAAMLLPQAKLTPSYVWDQLQLLTKKHRQLQKRLIQVRPSPDGAKKLHALVSRVVTAATDTSS